jgi:hypothetical protein
MKKDSLLYDKVVPILIGLLGLIMVVLIVLAAGILLGLIAWR